MRKTVGKLGLEDFLSEVYSEVVRTQSLVHSLIQEIAKLRSRETGEDAGEVSREIMHLADLNFSRIVNEFYKSVTLPKGEEKQHSGQND